MMMILGTPWFFLFKDKITTELMNALRPDVGVRIQKLYILHFVVNQFVILFLNIVRMTLTACLCVCAK